jgi:ribosome-associated heat shock protein Hsp15
VTESSEAGEGCRIDIWLWRARFCKTRSLAASTVAAGRVRLARGGANLRLDKPGRVLHCGDTLIVALAGRRLQIRIEALGTRRGPAPEARALYTLLGETGEAPRAGD